MIKRADSSQTWPNVMYDKQQIEQAHTHSQAVFRGYLPHDRYQTFNLSLVLRTAQLLLLFGPDNKQS